MLSLLFTIFTFFTTIVWSQTTSPCAQDCAQQSAAASGCTDANGKYNTQCLCTNLIAISADAGACIGANTTCSSTTPVEQIETTELEAFFKVTCNLADSTGTSLPLLNSIESSLSISVTSVPGTTSKADTAFPGATTTPGAPAGSDTIPAFPATSSSPPSSGSGLVGGASGNVVTGKDVLKFVVVVVAAVVGTLL